MAKGTYKTYAQKMRRANREAGYTVIALAIIAASWLVLGIGLSGLDVQIASTPIWIIGGTLGTWAVAIAVAVVLARRVFANFDLDDAEEAAAAGQGAEAGDTRG